MGSKGILEKDVDNVYSFLVLLSEETIKKGSYRPEIPMVEYLKAIGIKNFGQIMAVLQDKGFIKSMGSRKSGPLSYKYINPIRPNHIMAKKIIQAVRLYRVSCQQQTRKNKKKKVQETFPDTSIQPITKIPSNLTPCSLKMSMTREVDNLEKEIAKSTDELKILTEMLQNRIDKLKLLKQTILLY